MGLLLQADARLAPAPGDAFLVTDDQLLLCAVSHGAERMFGRSEPSIIHHPVGSLLLGVGSGEDGSPALEDLLRAAASGQLEEIVETVVVAADGTRGAYQARIGACGPPAAAILMIDAALS